MKSHPLIRLRLAHPLPMDRRIKLICFIVNVLLYALLGMTKSSSLPINPENGELITDSLEEETRQVMINIGEVLKEAGLDYDNIVKTSIFLKDMSFFPRVNEVYATYFKSAYPARETVAVAGLPKDVNVEISVIALY